MNRLFWNHVGKNGLWCLQEDFQTNTNQNDPSKDFNLWLTLATTTYKNSRVAEQAIRYPTDLSLLNESREISETLIDELYKLTELRKKPRTYRQQARKKYLALAKKRNHGGKARRNGTRAQLQYLRRNFRYIEELLNLIVGRCFPLPHKRQRQYWIIQHVYDQQLTMYKNRKRRCDDRIVSIHQPHVRPIIRGKASHKVEFGSKLSVSMVDGIAIVDRFGWDP